MKLKALIVVLASLIAVPAFGQLFVIGDGICCNPGNNEWPSAEGPEFAIDGVGQKYLNFGAQDNNFSTGFAVTPASGSTVAASMTLWAANDAEERDPATYEVWGTNATPTSTNPGDSLPIAAFTPISTGALTLPASRNGGGAAPLDAANSFSVSFTNTDAYTSYLVLFPTTKGPNQNSMQIAEVQLYDGAGTGLFAPGDAIVGGGVPVPEPSTGILALLCMIPVMSYIRRRR